MSNNQIPIIDLFAGPGGLGEGFSSITNADNERIFKIALSIECDEYAHQTLTLRSFLRQFPFSEFPLEYYEFVQGKKSINDLYAEYPDQAIQAMNEAWKFKLGEKDTNNIIDRKIRKVLQGEKNFVLIGGPPCQAYSLVGRARRRQTTLDKEDERVYLYREYYRILAEHRPAVFVMENVKGILSSKVENDHLFYQIIDDLKDPIKAYKKLKGEEIKYKSRINYKIYSLVKEAAYRELFELEPFFEPKDFVIKAEDYGIPQTRHRVILLGIRSDMEIVPELLNHLADKIPVEKVLNGLPRLRSGLSKQKDGLEEWKQCLKEIKNSDLKEFVDADIWKEILEVVNHIELPESNRGGLFVKERTKVDYLQKWYLDKRLSGVSNHETRSHIKEDIYRYLFV
jgi:DNA (cytosine-5)-methyltransferase 1